VIHIEKALLAAAGLLAATGCAAGGPAVRYEPGGSFRAGPIPAESLPPAGDAGSAGAEKLFELRLAGPGTEALPAVAGSYRIEGDTVLFDPAYPLHPGTRYVAVFLPGTPEAVSEEVMLPERDRTPTTTVEAVHPSADLLPENLLRLYVRFSAPMTRGQAWEHIRLLDGDGRAVDMPFLELDEELWDRSMTRLTVLIDPGRIKRGVRPLEEIGPALEAGKSYTLEVLPAWEDAEGKPLLAGHRKAFRVGPPDREPLEPRSWKLAVPRPGGVEPLAIGLGKPLDHGLLLSAIGIEGPDGTPVEGSVAILDGERTWSFAPARPWKPGEHAVVVATTLEDPAGNRIGRPFEVDAIEPFSKRLHVDVVRLPFSPAVPVSASR
jgi:hypothetical protein